MSYTIVEGSSFEPSAKGCACSVSSQRNMPISVSIDRRGVTRKVRTCLVYRVNKLLCVVRSETTDGSSAVLFQEDFIDQRGEFVWSKHPSNQTSAGYGVVAETDKLERVQDSTEDRRGCR